MELKNCPNSQMPLSYLPVASEGSLDLRNAPASVWSELLNKVG